MYSETCIYRVSAQVRTPGPATTSSPTTGTRKSSFTIKFFSVDVSGVRLVQFAVYGVALDLSSKPRPGELT